MPAVKYSAKGIVIKAAATAVPTTVVAQLKTIAMNVGDVALIDVTTHDSTTTKDFIHPGLRDTLEVDVTMVWDPADTIHELIRSSHGTGILLYVTVILTDAGNAQWACSGYVTAFGPPAMNVDGALEVTWKFKAKTLDVFTA